MLLRSLAFRVWWVPVFAVTVATAALTVGADTGDLPFFVHAADDLFSPAWADVYANPDLQVGPVQLLLLALADAAANALSLSTFTLLAFAVPVGVTGLFLLVIRRLLAERVLLTAAGVAFAIVGLPAAAYIDGHLAQVAVPLLWLLAGLHMRSGGTLSAGALLGLSAGLELWGMLGAVVLLVAPRLRAAVVGLVVQVSVAACLFAPFVLAGEFRMLDYHWVVNGDTLVSVFVEPGTDFTWGMRLAQGGTALAAGAALAWPLRRTLRAVWLGPLAVVAVRLALDPVRYQWYWLSLETVLVVGAVALGTGTLLRRYHPARV